MNREIKIKEEIVSFLKELRETIIATFESIEKQIPFRRTPWQYSKGTGGGEIGLLRGHIFEKGAVNFSEVYGPHFPTDEGSGPFGATGISLITHMANPHAPTVHFNLRYIETLHRFWFGGGYDLTPMGPSYPEDTAHFHQTAKHTLDSFDSALYPRFSQNAKEYFTIPHRGKERGVGGIFFDHYNTGNWSQDFALCKQIANTFLDAIVPIYHQRIATPFTPEQRDMQLQLRAHYVEFNLLYDRGTKFGFLSGGHPEAILCSLPPLVKW